MSLNEQLAELCGVEIYQNTDGQWQEYNPMMGNNTPIWNPTDDLNQLRMCYEALSEEQRESFAYENRYAPTDWAFTNPELVAQAILKAKGVS